LKRLAFKAPNDPSPLLTEKRIEGWHRAIPRRHENYTHRLLEKFVQRRHQ
jgi:hypothetical protein